MINKVQGYGNPLYFKGMSVEQVKRFIPKISDQLANEVSTNIGKSLPYDELCVIEKSNNIARYATRKGVTVPADEFMYRGKDNIKDKIEFLYNIVSDLFVAPLP